MINEVGGTSCFVKLRIFTSIQTLFLTYSSLNHSTAQILEKDVTVYYTCSDRIGSIAHPSPS